MTRKAKMNSDKVLLYITAKEMGMSEEQASDFAGVSRNTTYKWKKRGEAAEKDILKLLDENEDYDIENHKEYEYYLFYLSDKQSKPKMAYKLRKNLWHLSQDRMMTDKDGIHRIDKPGSAAANIALLKVLDEDFKESENGAGAAPQAIVQFNNIDPKTQEDLIAKMAAGQKQQQQSLLEIDENEDEDENEE